MRQSLKGLNRKNVPKWVQIASFGLWIFSLVGCAVNRTQPEAPLGSNRQPAGNPENRVEGSEKSSSVREKTIFQQQAIQPAVGTADYHYAMAQAYTAEGLTDEAIEHLKLTLIYDPHSALVYSRLAGEYVKKGLLPEALEAAKESVRLDPKFVDARLMYAGLLSAVKDAKGALAEYSEILKIDPKNSEAAVYRAQVLIEEDRVAEASQFLEGFVARQKDSSLAWYFLGRSYQKQSQWQKAEKALRKSLELRPGFVQASLALGIMLEETGSVPEAEKIFKDAYEETQESSVGQRYAMLLLKKEKYKEALPVLEAITASDPEDFNTLVKLGLIQMELKQFEASEKTFLRVINKMPEADRVRFYLANLYEEIGRKEDAASHFLKIGKESPFYADAVLHAASIYQTQNRPETAQVMIGKAIENSPKQPKLYLYLAGIFEEQGKLSEAASTLESGKVQLPEDERILYYLATIQERVGKTESAISTALQLLKINSENTDALNFLGYTWTMRGEQIQEAEKYLRKAVKLKPDNPYILDSWGWHLFVRGKNKEAIVTLEKAWKLKPEEATILEHLAEAYWKQGLVRKAFHLYTEALKYAPTEELKNKYLSKIETLRTEYGVAENPGRSVANE